MKREDEDRVPVSSKEVKNIWKRHFDHFMTGEIAGETTMSNMEYRI